MDGALRTATVRAKLSLAAPALRAASAELWSLPGLDRRYPEYLRTMHGVVRASVPLMEAAARRCAEPGLDETVTGPLREYLLDHIAEEEGHDDWLLTDLAALGYDATQPLTEQPSPAVARLVGQHYYWILHHHPVALLGYITVLEDNAPAARLPGFVVEATGAPRDALRTVEEHARVDTGHTEAAFDLLDRLPLTPGQAEAVTVSGLATAAALLDVYTHIIRVARRGEAR